MVRLSKTTLDKTLPWILLIGSIIGLVVSFALTYDKIQVLKNPSYVPSCNINPVISCGSVMSKPQSELFGIPNTIFGLIGFSVLGTFAALLTMKIVLPKKIWWLIQGGVTGGLLFAGYLFFQGIFRIHAICPYCFLIWITMPPMFWYTTLLNFRTKRIPVNNRVSNILNRFHGDVLIGFYVLFVAILLVKFWYYWSTLI